MVRAADQGGRRYSHGQLVLVRPADGAAMMLGQVRWLVTGQAGELVAGLKLLPGQPGHCAVRATGLNVKDEQYVPALTLGPVESLKLPPSLILEPGWFKPKRVIELFLEGSVRVRFTELLERGMDFERAAYEVLPD